MMETRKEQLLPPVGDTNEIAKKKENVSAKKRKVLRVQSSSHPSYTRTRTVPSSVDDDATFANANTASANNTDSNKCLVVSRMLRAVQKKCSPANAMTNNNNNNNNNNARNIRAIHIKLPSTKRRTAATAVDPIPLPPGWKAATDGTTGKAYYYRQYRNVHDDDDDDYDEESSNFISDHREEEDLLSSLKYQVLPSSVICDSVRDNVTGTTRYLLRPGWRAAMNRNSGRIYYYRLLSSNVDETTN